MCIRDRLYAEIFFPRKKTARKDTVITTGLWSRRKPKYSTKRDFGSRQRKSGDGSEWNGLALMTGCQIDRKMFSCILNPETWRLDFGIVVTNILHSGVHTRTTDFIRIAIVCQPTGCLYLIRRRRTHDTKRASSPAPAGSGDADRRTGNAELWHCTSGVADFRASRSRGKYHRQNRNIKKSLRGNRAVHGLDVYKRQGKFLPSTS